MGNGTFHIVSESILREIERKKEMLVRHPDYCLLRNHKKQRALQTEALKHSVSLELEGYTTDSPEANRRKARERQRGERDIQLAFDWGIANYSLGHSFNDFLVFLETLGRKVEPYANRNGFRRDLENVRILGATWSPPNPKKILRELALFFSDNLHLLNPIEKGVHAHFHTARIHPFNDGNGRTTRLFQNILFQLGGYLPASINRSERIEYLNLIDRAVNSYVMKNSSLDSFVESSRERVIDAVIKGSLTEKERGYYHALGGVVVKSRMTLEQTEFYDFLALKVRDSMNAEAESLYGSFNSPKR